MAYRGPPPFGEFSDWVLGGRPRFPRPPPPGHGRGNGPRPPWLPDWNRPPPPFAGPGPRYAGPRMPPHPTGNRPVMRDQPQWERIQQEAEHWKEKGNHAVKQDNYTAALECYQVAVGIAMTIPRNERQIAAIQSNQSYAFLRLGQPKEALGFGQECVDMNPKWHKGYFRMAQALQALGLYDNALKALASALRMCPMKPEQELEIVRDAVTYALMTPGGSEEIRKCRVKRSTWTELIMAAVNKDDWKTVKFLVVGDNVSSPAPVDCDLSAVKHLTPFIKNSTNKDLADWGQKLILFMLKRGAPYESLQEPERSALHVALNVGIRTGSFELLDRLLQDDYSNPQQRNWIDCDGNTLLHVAAMADIDSSVRLVTVQLLLSRSLETRTQNDAGKFPADYLRKSDPSYRLLRPADSEEHTQMQELKEKGNRFVRQNKNSRALEQYTEALKVVPQDANLRRQLQITAREVAQLHSNRAIVLLKMNRLEEALRSAEDCLCMDSNWFKGHVRLGKVSEKLEKYSDALHSYKRAFVCMMAASVTDDQIQVEILTDMSLLCRLAVDTKKCLSECKAPPDVWRKVIERVLRKPDYRSLLMLVTSKFTKRCNLESLDYHAIPATCMRDDEVYSSPADVEKLIMGILDRKGSTYFLDVEDPPLHTSMLIAIHTGSGQLFEYLLTQRLVRSSEVNSRDSRGDTLLHILARSDLINTFRGQTLFNKLIDYGADVNLINGDGHTADEYLPLGHPAQLQMVSIRNARRFEAFDLRPEANTKKPQQKQAAKPPHAKKSKKPDSEPVSESEQLSATLMSSLSAVCEKALEVAQHHRERGKPIQALNALCRILRMQPEQTMEEYEQFAEKARNSVCDIIVNSASDLPTKDLLQMQDVLSIVARDLGHHDSWQRVRDLLTALKDRIFELAQLAKLVDVAQLIDGCYNRGNNRRRRELLNLLLEFGAPPEGATCGAVKAAFENRDSSLLSCLLTAGASLKHVEWPLHEALNVALQTGNFDLLTVLLDQPELDLSVAQSNGNTLFHDAASAPFSKHALRAVELLSGTSCNPNIRNNSGKTAHECLTEKGKKNDRRAQFIKMAANKFPSSTRKPKKKAPPPRGHAATDAVDVGVSRTDAESAFVENLSDGTDGEKGEPKINTATNPREECRSHIADMIESLPEPGCPEQRPVTPEPQEDNDSQRDETSDHDEVEETEIETGDIEIYNTQTSRLSDDAATEVTDTTAVKTSVDDDGDNDDDDDDDTEIDPSIFDDLVWEVECTANVWKLLKNKQVPAFLKRRSITKIKRLANGDWTRTLAKKLDHVPADIQLYEAKLSKGARIVWELAVAFSPRRSEDADRRLGANASESGVKGGRIYAEVIRVWDIVLQHDNLLRAIGRIIRSHNRGSECILQKQLRGIIRQKFHSSSAVVHQRVPILYVEIDDDQERQNPLTNDAELSSAAQRYFPPASPNETEYHIMKFYAFTSTLVTNILADQGTKVDFPFRVTELEHAIIHLQPRPPTAILLLGRSGTGKTTCCVYRLWSAFIRYWEKATAADAPLMPRKVFYNDSPNDECDAQKDPVESPADDAVCVRGTSGEDSACAGETSDWDHLRQVFVTKNPVLCSEVQKNFCDLSHASNTARHHTAVEQDDLPSRLQDVRPDMFPLFLTMRLFLLMLDASMPDPYFERESDGSLAREVAGWGENNTQLSFIPDVTFDDDTDEIAPLDGATDDDVLIQKQHRKKRDPRREVTYEVFVHELWPKMNKKLQLDCHASLVWMEIRSFIQGSFEALMGDTGYLSLDEYLQLGKKRAGNFNSDRSDVYELYKEYRRLKQNMSMYDENDLVYHLYHRLTSNGAAPEWIVHEFYVDETQDFTQAELCLLIRCAADPNATFFTGDTAQSIMRGIAFRFEDLRSLFYYAQQSFRCQDKTSTIQVPRLYQLTHNYRSHAGILALAASIVDLLIEFFPNSFDRLEKDCGLFEGPKPVLLESCSISDLALLLRGSQRQTSQIEFGAHQAILVANEQAREHIPEELSLGLVLTIFEAKGLEFDDILLFNFFKDSQASQEWRVVTEHLNAMLEQQQLGGATSNQSGVIEIDPSVVDSDDRPRPLTFDPDQHKVLNSELKYLYTALTRARVNVWIFDEDVNARAPMFEYFRACHLVEVVTKEGTDVTEQELPDRVFAEASTRDQWRHRGDEFYKHHLYNVAAKCYVRSGDSDKEKMSRAQQRALEASRLCDNPRKLRHEFLFAAEEYLDCGMTTEAARCLCNAKETLLAAQLYEKMGQSHHAAALYKKLGRMGDASRAYENDSKYGQAVELLVAAKHFDKAIDVVSRYHIKTQEYEKQGLPVPPKMLANRPGSETRSVKQLCLEAAEFHHQSGRTDDMLGSLDRLPDVSDKVQFLLQRGLVRLAAPIMQENGKAFEAAEAFYKAGDLEMALEYASAETQLPFRADCLLSASRHMMSRDEPSDDERSRAEKYLLEALSLFLIIGDDRSGAEANKLLGRSAETKLLLGRLRKDSAMVSEAYETFHKLHNDIGQVACTKTLLDQNALQDNDDACSRCLRCLQMLFDLARALEFAENALEKDQTRHVRTFYGLQDTDKRREYRIMRGQGARINACMPAKVRSTTGDTLEEKRAHEYIISDLVRMVPGIVNVIREKAKCVIGSNRPCERHSAGLECEDSQDNSCPHFVATRQQRKQVAQALLWMVQLDVLIASVLKRRFMDMVNPRDSKMLRDLETKPRDKWLREFYQAMFPEDGRVSDGTVELVRNIRENARLRDRIMRCTEEWLWKPLEHKDRQANTDCLIMVHNVRLMCQPNLESLVHLLLPEERWFKEHPRKSRSPPELGIHKKSGLIYFRKYIDGMVFLYRKCDPVEAFASINKLLHFIAACPRAPLLPSFANAAMLLEQQVILALCLNLHSRSGTSGVLPECYLAAVNFRDGLYAPKGAGGLYSIVQRYGSSARLTTGRLMTLPRVMCGRTDKSFDMFVFDSDDQIRSGECERVLILALVMLSNAGINKAMPIEAENMLRDRLGAVRFPAELDVPRRVRTALAEVQAAVCKRDVVRALKHLLEKRDPKEPLRKCVWSHTRGCLSVQQVSDVSAIDDDRRYKPCTQVAVQPLEEARPDPVTAEKTEEASRGDAETEENWEDEFFTDECIEKAKTDQEQLAAESSTLQMADGASAHAAPPELQHQMSTADPFADIVIDDTMCQVCYVPFAQGAEPASPGGEQLHPRVLHEMSREHRLKQYQFDSYKNWFMDAVFPMLQMASSMVTTYRSAALLYLERAVMQLRDAQKDVEDHRHWDRLQNMDLAARNLEYCLNEAQGTAARLREEEKQRTRLEADTQAALGADQGVLQADDDQYNDDEAGPIMKVAEAPRSRKSKPRYWVRNKAKSSGRRN